ncbi:MAG: ATP-binding protein [Bacillota bacterium]|nr:ATP-binding protein [Bacillota bacterium]
MEEINADLNKILQMLESGENAFTAGDEEVYHCPLCRDTGWISDGASARLCKCRKKQQSVQRSSLPPKLAKCRFENFYLNKYSREALPGKESSYQSLARQALIAVREFAAAYLAGQAPRGIVLTGGNGCGKTHLVAATANLLLEKNVDVFFQVVPEFLDQLRDSYHRENQGMREAELIRRAYTASVLVLDDLGAHNFTEWVQNKLFAIVNYRLNYELPCLITTNLSLPELGECIGRRTTSRLMEGCDVLELASKQDFRIQKQAEARG